jgi:hypothetical protein
MRSSVSHRKETCGSRMPISTRSRPRIVRPTLFFAFRFSALAIHRHIRKEVQRHALAGAGWICEGGWACGLPQCRGGDQHRTAASNRRRSTSGWASMLRYFAAALLGVFCFGTPAVLAVDCFPHCDFYSNYGPYVIGPSLYCNPRCGLEGNCSPFLECKQQSHGIRRSEPATASPCLADNGRCTSNYQCCSGSCNWSESAHAYFCGTGLLFSRHPPRPPPR